LEERSIERRNHPTQAAEAGERNHCSDMGFEEKGKAVASDPEAYVTAKT
jgi:hypothetical protein